MLEYMRIHYSQPKGFVGRNICYLIKFNGLHYGTAAFGSSTRFLPGRNEFFGLLSSNDLVKVANNIFYHIEKIDGKYPVRNFTTKVIKSLREREL